MRFQRVDLLRAGCALAAFISLPSVAAAEQGTATSEEIIVTATKRAASVQDVPFSVNAQTQQDIQRTGSGTLEELSRNVAGLAIQNLGPGQSQVSIRGVSAGQVIRDQPGVKEQVGIYLDESVISLSLFTPDVDLYDLNRVETLRGPQGTLFGSGSVGGTIRYITNPANLDQFEGSVEGNINTIDDGGTGGHVKGMLNVPFADGTAALRIVGYHTEYAGFIDALREGGGIDEDVNSGTRTGGRISLTVHPTDNITITPRVVYQKIDMDGFNREEVFNLFANPFTTTRPAVTFAERQQFLLLNEEFKDEFVLADVTATIGFDGFDLTSVSSYIDRSILVSRDASALTGSVTVRPLGLCCGFPESAALLPSNLRDTTSLQQFTQEVRLSSNGGGRFQWLLGAFYADIQRDYAQRLPTPGYDAVTDAALGPGTAEAFFNGFGPDSPYSADLPYDISQFAVFGEASYDFTDRLTLTVGARYYDFDEERRFHSGGLFSNGDDRIDSTASEGVSPRVLVSYRATDSLTLNAQASKGFRVGGANDPLNIPICDAATNDAANFGGFPTYDDETLWNYEGGAKFNRGGLTFNVAGYYSDIKNLQVTADAGSCSSRVVFNADAHSTGLEAELGATLFEGFEVSLAGSVVQAEFDETRNAVGGGVLAGIREGNRLPSVPDYQVAATAAYYFPFASFGSDTEGFFAASVQHVGSRFTQPGDQEAGAATIIGTSAPPQRSPPPTEAPRPRPTGGRAPPQ
jgi:iron complex outermembrane receptor protein